MSISDLTRAQFDVIVGNKVEEELNNMIEAELLSYYRNAESELYEYNPTTIFDTICEDNGWNKDKVEQYMRKHNYDEIVVQTAVKYCIGE